MSNPRSREKRSNSPGRICWICLETEDDDLTASWMQPCQCQGSSKWIHRTCLEIWIDSKQSGDTSIVVLCPQCNTEYIIVFPSLGMLANIMDLIDSAIYKIYLLMSAGVIFGCIYWSGITYGAITVMEVLGRKEGLHTLEQSDPIFLLLGLPLIPVVLIVSRLIKWDNLVLKLWRNYSNKIPLIKCFVGSNVSSTGRLPTERSAFTDIPSQTRLFCGGLMLPTIASFTGKVLFRSKKSNLERTIWGGAIYLMAKGICKLYLRQKHYLRLCQRSVLNYWERTDDSPSHGGNE